MTEREKIIEEITNKFRECPYPAPAVARRGKPHTTVNFSGIPAESIRLRDEFYMACAIELGRAAAELGEIPVGAVIVRGGEIIAADFNGRETEKNALYHAECAAIDKACGTLGGWRLPGCELYVTLEPCIMCAGAVISSRMPRVIYGADDRKGGFFGSVADAASLPLNHKPVITRGILNEECAALMREFFEKKREMP